MEPERGGCVDVNECAQTVQPCTSNQFCVNKDGSYSCLGNVNNKNIFNLSDYYFWLSQWNPFSCFSNRMR